MRIPCVATAATALLVACSEGAPPPPQRIESPPPAQAPVAGPAFAPIDAPAGEYRHEPSHSSLSFSVTHLGLSNYIMRFTDYTVDVTLDPADPAASAVEVVINAASIDTDFHGDYKATHPESDFASWQQELAMSPNFLNAGQYPEIRFRSTRIAPGAAGVFSVEGELQMLGRTLPVTLEATLVGATRELPMLGIAAIGFSASGKFSRSAFGMNYLTEPPLVGDVVSVRFEGELHQLAETASNPVTE